MLSKNEGQKDIEHSMSIENLILGVYSVTVSYLIRYDSSLQNATDIITKYERSILQNASGFLLQNTTVLLQNAALITNSDNFITKCDSYYKMRQYTLHKK